MSKKTKDKRLNGISIVISSEDDAMTFNPIGEIARALREIATHVEREVSPNDVSLFEHVVFDTNGNRIGRWRYSNGK